MTRNGSTVLAGLLLRRGDADAMICGAVGRYHTHLRHVSQVVGKRSGVQRLCERFPPWSCRTDRSSSPIPTWPMIQGPEQLAEITLMAAEAVRRFGLAPKVALVSHSNFGTEDTASARKMREVLALVRAKVSGARGRGRDAR